jgi:N-acetylneuraminic acid mutarotase
MSIDLRSSRMVRLFICCIALLFSACSKQALEGPAPTEPLPPTSPTLPPYIPSNTWQELSISGSAFGFANPFVVDNQVYICSQQQLYHYDAVNGTTSLVDSDEEFKMGVYLFSHQSKAYFLKWKKDLWAYDMNTHTWTDKANYPGSDTYEGTSAATATKGYIMGGQSGVDANQFVVVHAENWEYNFANDTWTKKANTPGWPRHRGCSFAVGDKIYFGTGETFVIKIQVNPVKAYQEPMQLKDWWEYNTLTNTWTQKADFGGGIRKNASGFVVNGKVYAGAGRHEGYQIQMSDLWRYDPSSNTWLNQKTCPIVSDIWDKLEYVGTNSFGYGINDDFNEFWRYQP